jgi:hypothetical protein
MVLCVCNRNWSDGPDAPPIKIEYGSAILGRKGIRRTSYSISEPGGGKTQGSSAPLGKRNIPTLEQQYEALKKGTMD